MTNNEVLDTISHLEAGVVFAWIVGILALISGFIFACVKCYRLIEKYRKGRNKLDSEHSDFEQMKTNDIEMQSQLNAVIFCMQRLVAEELNKRMKSYYSIGYIPVDEMPSFQQLFHAYEGVGGNGDMKERYEKAIHELEMK